MGNDLLSTKDGLVIYSNKSFITKKGRYNSLTNEFISFDNQAIDQSYVEDIKDKINNKFYISKKILETNFYNIFKNHMK